MGYGMWNHMFNYGYGSDVSWWWMLGFMLLRTLIAVGAIVFIVKLIKGNSGYNNSQAQSNRAIEILRERYALGEIGEEEYNKKYKMLKS